MALLNYVVKRLHDWRCWLWGRIRVENGKRVYRRTRRYKYVTPYVGALRRRIALTFGLVVRPNLSVYARYRSLGESLSSMIIWLLALLLVLNELSTSGVFLLHLCVLIVVLVLGGLFITFGLAVLYALLGPLSRYRIIYLVISAVSWLLVMACVKVLMVMNFC